MSDQSRRLLDAIAHRASNGQYDVTGVVQRDHDNVILVAALRAVLDLHKSDEFYRMSTGCDVCGPGPYPCATVQAIAMVLS